MSEVRLNNGPIGNPIQFPSSAATQQLAASKETKNIFEHAVAPFETLIGKVATLNYTVLSLLKTSRVIEEHEIAQFTEEFFKLHLGFHLPNTVASGALLIYHYRSIKEAEKLSRTLKDLSDTQQILSGEESAGAVLKGCPAVIEKFDAFIEQEKAAFAAASRLYMVGMGSFIPNAIAEVWKWVRTVPAKVLVAFGWIVAFFGAIGSYFALQGARAAVEAHAKKKEQVVLIKENLKGLRQAREGAEAGQQEAVVSQRASLFEKLAELTVQRHNLIANHVVFNEKFQEVNFVVGITLALLAAAFATAALITTVGALVLFPQIVLAAVPLFLIVMGWSYWAAKRPHQAVNQLINYFPKVYSSLRHAIAKWRVYRAEARAVRRLVEAMGNVRSASEVEGKQEASGELELLRKDEARWAEKQREFALADLDADLKDLQADTRVQDLVAGISGILSCSESEWNTSIKELNASGIRIGITYENSRDKGALQVAVVEGLYRSLLGGVSGESNEELE
jgi:hypothetical protein